MKTIFIVLFTFFIALSVHSQEVYIYGEGGKKLYFQVIDSVIQVKFNDNLDVNEKQRIVNILNMDYDYSNIAKVNRLIVPINDNMKLDYENLRSDKVINYVNLSLLSDDGLVQIPTNKILVRIMDD